MNTHNLAIILAAGEGTRMKSAMPKVLHKIAGRSMLGHVLAAVNQAQIAYIAVIIGPDHDNVAAEIKAYAPHAEIIVQDSRLGTAHAVLHARSALSAQPKSVIVLFGDTPLVSASTITKMIDAVDETNAVAALGFNAVNATGYGRLILENNSLCAIREHKDATDEERKVNFCNAGLMAFYGQHALEILTKIDNDNVQKEYYLPDAVHIARQMQFNCIALEADANEVLGVNDRVQLAQAEAIYQTRLRVQHMNNGVTLQAPETVFFSYDTEIAADVTLEPNIVFGEGVKIAEGCTIHSFSRLAGTICAKNVSVGPFARLRPGTVIGENAKIGNFVEIKASLIGAGAKMSHLSYIGDAEIGVDANIGAGTITCNYDGYNKFRTVIGDGAFIGSNSALVAPVKIGKNAYVGAGSVILDDVPEDALGVARATQIIKQGWGEAFRASAKPNNKLK